MRKPTIGWDEPAWLQEHLLEKDRQAKLRDKEDQERQRGKQRADEVVPEEKGPQGIIKITLKDIYEAIDAK